jgi:hypothetical protein
VDILRSQSQSVMNFTLKKIHIRDLSLRSFHPFLPKTLPHPKAYVSFTRW